MLILYEDWSSSKIVWLLIGSKNGEGKGLIKNLKTSDTSVGVFFKKTIKLSIFETIINLRRNFTNKNFKDLFFFNDFWCLKNFKSRPIDNDK